MAKKLSKPIMILCLSFLVSSAICSYTQAQEKNADLKVYQKFFKATNIEAQYNLTKNIAIVQLQQIFAASFREMIRNMGDTTPEQKDRLKQLFEQAMESYVKRIKAKITDIMPLNELIDNVYYPVFAKQFTVAEIKELTDFFESPIGKKFVSATPTAMQESMKMTNEKYALQIEKIGNKIAEEELKKIVGEIEKLQKKN